MPKLEIFDPPMCCATGICGNSVDPKLVSFASDLEWLKAQGINVIRYGLSFEPDAFVKNQLVKETLQTDGNNCLPIVIWDGRIVAMASYPSRQKLAQICGLKYNDEECCCDECDCATSIQEETKESECCCGPDCDCHKSGVSDKAKKILFVVLLVAIVAILGIKFAPKAHAASIFYPPIASFSQIKPSQEVVFVYIPSKGGKMSNKTNSALLSAKQTLESRNTKVELYSLNPSSADYSAQDKTPAVMVIYKGKAKSLVAGNINANRILQAYMATTLAGGCGAGCPCHRH